MKKTFLSLLLLFTCNFIFATDYYISNSGNDANNGTSVTMPWKTLTKLNSSWTSIVSGDRVLFQCADTFFGSINVTKSGITLGSYGIGAKPIITGFHIVTTWTSAGNNKWTTTIPTSLNFIRLLTINGQLIRNGRYPNYVDGFAGWIRYTNQLAAVSPVTVTSATAIPTNLSDGELVLFKNNWNLDVMPINSITGNNITCTNPAGQYGITANAYLANWGFFVQNSINALDQQNEWHISNATKVLTIFSTTNPSTNVVKIPIVATLISTGNQSNITIDGLDIQGATEKGIATTGGSGITIKNCVVRYIQGWGIDFRSSNLTVTDNTVRDIGSNGIWFNGGGTIARNIIKACGVIEGLAGLTSSGSGSLGNQDSQHSGIDLGTNNGNICSQNILDSIGYIGIRFGGNNMLIENNVIQNVCITKSDGGAIYCWDTDGNSIRSNRRIKNNIILNTGKFLYGTNTPGGNTQGYGIYFDGGANNILCDSNVIGPNIYNQNSICSYNNITNTQDDAAIMLNFAWNTTIRRNIVFGWPDAMEMWRYAGYHEPNGNRFVDNALYVNGGGTDLCTWNQSFQYHTLDNSTIAQIQTQVQALGVMDSNFVSNFAPSPFTYKGQAVNPGGPVSLSAWRTFSGKDANTTSFPNTTPDFQVNTTSTPRTYSFPGLSKKDFRGNVYNDSAIILPFYGNIFFPNDTGIVLKINDPIVNQPPINVTKTQVFILPNPSLDKFELSIKSKSNRNVTILVYDIQGKLLFQNTGAHNKRYFFGSNFLSGTYIVNVIQGGENLIFKIIKG
jgi:hypothetical protein